MKRILTLIFALGLSIAALAEKKDSSLRRLTVLPVPTFGYEPETRWNIGAVALFNVRLYKNDTLTRPGNFKTEVTYTQNKQVIFDLGYNLYLKNDSWFLSGDNLIMKFPEYYWGIGNYSQDADKELYSASRIELQNAFLKRWKNTAWYFGFNQRLQSVFNLKPKDNTVLFTDNTVGSKGGVSSGLGLSANYDTRDNLLTPTKGAFIASSYTHFNSFLGSDFRFEQILIDARAYKRLSNTSVLAAQVYTLNHFSGAVPFRMMALMGSESHQRGYYQGRYRDNCYLSGQVELRQTVWKSLGFTAFAGGGQVASAVDGYTLYGLKPSYGLGFRLKVDKKDNINLRIDYAMGYKTQGFYFAFGEAF